MSARGSAYLTSEHAVLATGTSELLDHYSPASWILKSLGEYEHLYESRNWNDALAVREKKPKKWWRIFLRLLSKHGEKDVAKVFTDDPKQSAAQLGSVSRNRVICVRWSGQSVLLQLQAAVFFS